MAIIADAEQLFSEFDYFKASLSSIRFPFAVCLQLGTLFLSMNAFPSAVFFSLHTENFHAESFNGSTGEWALHFASLFIHCLFAKASIS